MTKLLLCRSMLRQLMLRQLLPRELLWSLVALCSALSNVYGQNTTYPEQEVQVHNLPSLTAISTHKHDVLRTAVQIVFHDRDICCGRNSALGDSLEAADPKSLKDVASRLEGRHLLSDGRPITVMTEYLTPEQASAGHLVAMILNQHAPLMLWNGHVYVVYGLSFVENVDTDGGVMYVTHKFMLLDPRPDSQREVVFDRLTEDAGKVQGLLFVDWKPQ